MEKCKICNLIVIFRCSELAAAHSVDRFAAFAEWPRILAEAALFSAVAAHAIGAEPALVSAELEFILLKLVSLRD